MEISGLGSFLKNSRFGSYFDASSFVVNLNPSSKVAVREEVEKKKKSDAFLDEDGWGSVLISWIRIIVCFVTMVFTTFIWALIMLVLFPWPYQRIRQGNIYGHVSGRLLMWILGNSIKIEGAEYSDERAIYISNHASPIDIVLTMWLTPTGTIGIAKKEIIWYPLFGKLYVLANHIRIDRTNPSAAIESMKKAAHAIVKNNLSLIIFPEGTRSKNGRLLPFKKDWPIVPIVLTGTHLAWRKGSLHTRPAPVNVKFLPPIRTDDWTADKLEDYVEMVHDVYVKNLPESQKHLHYKYK